MEWQHSQELFQRAQKIIPGGVNSPVRAFGSVGGEPLFFKSARGAYLFDEDQNRYIDYVGSWGPAILGHSHPEVVQAVVKAAEAGLSFGAPTAGEITLAEKIRALVPSMEMVRLVSSGTESCMSALRLARAFTGRSKILKFEGCYHGHADMLLVKAGSGAATLGIPGSDGVPAGTVADTLTVPYNDLQAVQQVFEKFSKDIAAVIVEPIVGNAGFIRPVDGFLSGLRKITASFGALLVFDEVMTGMRAALNGVQGLTGIKPDLTTLGKVIGGGLPLAAYGGRRDIMAKVAPLGSMYQAGTLSGNPVAVACGLKTLEILETPGLFNKLTATTQELMTGLARLAKEHDLPLQVDSEGGMFGFFFSQTTVRSLDDAKKSDTSLFKNFFWRMLKKGIYLAPSAFEAGFVSTAHSPSDIAATLQAAKEVFGELREGKY